MPKCPECGYSRNSEAEWFVNVSFQGNPTTASAGLIVCPSCDVVLGGGDIMENSRGSADGPFEFTVATEHEGESVQVDKIKIHGESQMYTDNLTQILDEGEYFVEVRDDRFEDIDNRVRVSRDMTKTYNLTLDENGG
jgi:predicted  nucleic acid-binding Zn-ribbon protein